MYLGLRPLHVLQRRQQEVDKGMNSGGERAVKLAGDNLTPSPVFEEKNIVLMRSN